MTLTNKQRAQRCAEAITNYSDDDLHISLIDLLTDAAHWCNRNGRCIEDVLATALMHFEAEITEEADV